MSTVHLRSPINLLVIRPAVEISGKASLGEAARRMRGQNVSALLVDGGRAIVSEGDLTRAVAAGPHGLGWVGQIATPHPITVPGETTIIEAAALMLNEEVRHLVVRRTPKTLGVVSLRAVMAVLIQAADPEPWLADLRQRTRMIGSEIWLG